MTDLIKLADDYARAFVGALVTKDVLLRPKGAQNIEVARAALAAEIAANDARRAEELAAYELTVISLRAELEADRAQQWRPIETAPKKHGDLLLGWVRYEKRGEDDDGNPYAEDGGTVDFIEWQDGGEHGEGYFMAMAGPWGDASDWITHWMPIPTPPKD